MGHWNHLGSTRAVDYGPRPRRPPISGRMRGRYRHASPYTLRDVEPPHQCACGARASTRTPLPLCPICAERFYRELVRQGSAAAKETRTTLARRIAAWARFLAAQAGADPGQ